MNKISQGVICIMKKIYVKISRKASIIAILSCSQNLFYVHQAPILSFQVKRGDYALKSCILIGWEPWASFQPGLNETVLDQVIWTILFIKFILESVRTQCAFNFIWLLSERKTFEHISHLAMMLLKLPETARKLQKTDKNTRIYGGA